MGEQGAIGHYISGVEIIPSGRLRVAYDEEIQDLNWDKTPLLKLLSSIGKKGYKQTEFKWMTEERPANWIQTTAVGGAWASGAAASGTFTVSTDDVWLFAKPDIVKIPSISNSNILVTAADQSTGVVTAETVGGGNVDLSGVGSDLPKVLLIADSFETGGNRGIIKSQQPSENYNYIQIIQTPLGITTTDAHRDYRGGAELDRQRKKKAIEHAFKLEKNLWFGERKRWATGKQDGVYEQFASGGVRNFLSTNVTDANGALTQDEFATWLKAATRYNQKPIVMAGELIFEALATWLNGKVQVTQSEKTLGMAVTNYLTKYGDVVPVMAHRELFTDDYAGVAFCIDQSDLKYVFMEGLDTHLEVDIQTPGQKQKIDEFRTWMSLQLGNEKRHGYLYGATSISTS